MWWRILTLNLKRFFNCLEIGDWPEHGCGAVSRNISVKEEIRPWMWTPSSHRLGSEMNKKTKGRKPVEQMVHPHVDSEELLGLSFTPSNLSLVCLLVAICSTTVMSNVTNIDYTIFLKASFFDQRHNFLSDSSEYCLCLKKWSVGSSWPTILISSHKTHYKWPG